MSPSIVTRKSLIVPSRSRIVSASSKPCEGCSCVPSPAFTLRGKPVRWRSSKPPRGRASAWTAASAAAHELAGRGFQPEKGDASRHSFQSQRHEADCLVMRHAASGPPGIMGRSFGHSGGGTPATARHEHPSQGLLDALTIRDRLGTIKDLRVTILGDILHSRVARSNIHLLGNFGCRFTLCGPAMWVPRELEKSHRARRFAASTDLKKRWKART